MTKPFARVTQVWTGGPDSLVNPEDMDTITLSKKALIEYGGADLEKVNYTVEYDVTDLNYAANLSMALIFDKTITVGQTDLKSVQGTGIASFRMNCLPKYDNQKRLGSHTLDIVLKLRPRYSILRWLDNYKDFTELRTVADSITTRHIVLVE